MATTKKKATTRKKRAPNVSGLLIGRARQSWTWYSLERKAVKKAAQISPGWAFCAECGLRVLESDTQVDHLDPVVAIGSDSPKIIEGVGAFGWDQYLTRLWSSASNLSVKCSLCHKAKTKAEASARKEKRREKK